MPLCKALKSELPVALWRLSIVLIDSPQIGGGRLMDVLRELDIKQV